MKELLKELLKHETLLVTKYRAKNQKVIKPSSIVLSIIGMLYLLSPIDLVPEAWIKPAAFGFIDDIIVIAVIAMYVYSDIGGVIVNAEVQPSRVEEQPRNREPIIVPGEDRSSDHLVPVPPTVDSVGRASSLESLIGSIADDPDPGSSSAVNVVETPFLDLSGGSKQEDSNGNSSNSGNEASDIYAKFFGKGGS